MTTGSKDSFARRFTGRAAACCVPSVYDPETGISPQKHVVVEAEDIRVGYLTLQLGVDRYRSVQGGDNLGDSLDRHAALDGADQTHNDSGY